MGGENGTRGYARGLEWRVMKTRSTEEGTGASRADEASAPQSSGAATNNHEIAPSRSRFGVGVR